MLVSKILAPIALVFFATPAYAATCGNAGEPACIGNVITILQKIIGLLAPAAGIAFFIMLIVGGYKFLTYGGDPKAAGGARTTLTFAVLGIILVIASWLILQIIAEVTGVDVTVVNLPIP